MNINTRSSRSPNNDTKQCVPVIIDHAAYSILKITLNKSGAFDNLKRFFSFFLRAEMPKEKWAFFFVSIKVRM